MFERAPWCLGALAVWSVACGSADSSTPLDSDGGAADAGQVGSGVDGGVPPTPKQPFCASAGPSPTFCEDFDGPARDGGIWGFTFVSTDQASATADTTSVSSPPHSLRIMTEGKNSFGVSRAEFTKLFKSAEQLHVEMAMRIEKLGWGRLIPLRFLACVQLEVDLRQDGAGYIEPSTSEELVRHPFSKPWPMGTWQRLEIDANCKEGTVRLRFGGEDAASGPMTTARRSGGWSLLLGSNLVAEPEADASSTARSDESIVDFDDVLVRLQ
jgi:hypothetical protein